MEPVRCASCACWLHSSCDPPPGGGNGDPPSAGVGEGTGERVGVRDGVGEGVRGSRLRITSGRYSDAARSGIGAETDTSVEEGATSGPIVCPGAGARVRLEG